MLQQYVNLKFSQRSPASVSVLDDYDTIAQIGERKRAVILGTAGGGKTIFMRYLWIHFFVESNKIPIFLELRRLNDLTSIDILTYIFRNIISGDEKAGMAVFDRYVKDGKFIFVFDGFDEVSADKREAVEKQILQIASRYPKNLLIVSSRPDGKFDAWQDFTTYRVLPLDTDQVKSLIERVDFDQAVKRKFLDGLNKGLFEKHASFLSSPLLITMMLLTFQHFAEIPQKIHVFYDLAYQTLFSKHDALKEAYSREKYSKFPIDVFRRRLSCLCVLSYIDEKFEFSYIDVLNYINRSADLDSVNFDSESFLKDLLESVCILQQDGLEITFTHRSFQEYFAAVYLISLQIDKLKVLLPRLARRESDDVFAMLVDMNRDLIEEAYVVPAVKKSLKKARGVTKIATAIEILRAYGFSLFIYIDKRSSHFLTVPPNDDVALFRNLAGAMYPAYFSNLNSRIAQCHELDRAVFKDIPVELKKFSGQGRILVFGTESTGEKNLDDSQIIVATEWFERSGHGMWIRESEKAFRNLLEEVPRKSRARATEMRKILNL